MTAEDQTTIAERGTTEDQTTEERGTTNARTTAAPSTVGRPTFGTEVTSSQPEGEETVDTGIDVVTPGVEHQLLWFQIQS